MRETLRSKSRCRESSNMLGFAFSALILPSAALVYNTFDGPGFPSCHNVSRIEDATSYDHLVSIVKKAAQSGSRIRAAGKGHMWYDTQCSDAETIIVRTEGVAGIYDFDLPPGASEGSVVVDAGVTFFQLAEYLHDRGASVGYTLTNWNISFGGSVAMGAHRSSIREHSMVAAGALAMDIIDGRGEVRRVERGESEEWLAASTSLGLLGVIARIKLKVYPDSKVYAKQETYDEKDILEGDIYGLIAPYATANLWVGTFLPLFLSMLLRLCSGGRTRESSIIGTMIQCPRTRRLRRDSRIRSL